jgi:hypothetical protein
MCLLELVDDSIRYGRLNHYWLLTNECLVHSHRLPFLTWSDDEIRYSWWLSSGSTPRVFNPKFSNLITTTGRRLAHLWAFCRWFTWCRHATTDPGRAIDDEGDEEYFGEIARYWSSNSWMRRDEILRYTHRHSNDCYSMPVWSSWLICKPSSLILSHVLSAQMYEVDRDILNTKSYLHLSERLNVQLVFSSLPLPNPRQSS